MNKYEELGKLLIEIAKTKKYTEVVLYQSGHASISGYCGYDSYRFSNIEDTELGQKFILALATLIEEA